MSTDLQLASGSTTERYETLLRIAEALSACSEPEEEVPLAELDKTGINIPTGSLSASGREEIERIVREMIGEMSDGVSRKAATEYDERQREEIERVLGETKGRVGGAEGAAARLGINRTTLLARMKKLGIDPKQFA